MRPSAGLDQDLGTKLPATRGALTARHPSDPPHNGETNGAPHALLDPEASRARYETYWNNTAECLYIVQVRPDGGFVYEGLNPAHERLTGLTNAQVAGRTPHECLPAEIADHLCAHYRECVAGGAPIQYEHVLDLPGGRRRWSSTLSPMRDPKTGRITLILAGCRDITREHDSQAEAERTRAAAAAARAWTLSILAGVRDGFLALDQDFIVIEVNQTTLQWLGLRREDLVGRSYVESFPDAPLARPEVRQRLARDGAFHVEFESHIRRGRWLDLQAYRVPGGYSVFVRDVTKRKRSRRALERAKSQLDATLDAMSSHVAVLDHGGRILRVNASWRELLRSLDIAVPRDGVGRGYLEIAALGGIERRDMHRLRNALKLLQRGVSRSFCRTVRMLRGPGEHWYQVNGARFEVEGAPMIVLSHEDVTAIHEAQLTINTLSQRLLNLQEEERQRIAVELHDSTAQQLTAIGLYMIPLRRRLEDDPAVARNLADVERTLDEAQKEIRNFSYLLHPPYLDRDGLKVTLDRFVEGYAARTGLRAESQIPDAVDSFAPDVQRALLRVVQEALTNVHRHAAASEVQVRMKATLRLLILSVADNGHGLDGSQADPTARRRPSGLGLPGMHARVHQLGGTMRILTGAQGTTVHARIPLARCRA